MTRVRLALAAAAVVLVAACGDSGPTQPIDQPTADETFDVATYVGDAVAETVSLLRTQEGAFGAPSADAFFTGEWKSDCEYNATNGRFACPVLFHEGRTVARGFQLLDASARPQSAYDATTTASAIFVTTIFGTVSHDGLSVEFTRARTITVSGLGGSESQHIINGTGTGATARTTHTAGGTTRTYSMTDNKEAITNVVVPFPRAEGVWPRSGTIAWQLKFARDVAIGQTHSGALTATVTFTGAQVVEIVISGQHYSLDLATGKVAKV
jgi:hypothetical protein